MGEFDKDHAVVHGIGYLISIWWIAWPDQQAGVWLLSLQNKNSHRVFRGQS